MSYTRLPGKSANAVDDYEAARTAFEEHNTLMLKKEVEAEGVETEYAALRDRLYKLNAPSDRPEWKLSWPNKSSWTDAPEAEALAELDEWHKNARAALQQLYAIKHERAQVLAAMQTAPHTLHDEYRAMFTENQRLRQEMQAAETVLRAWRTAKRARRE